MSEFVIYPAIDLLDGKCVQLVQGDYNQGTVYNNDPVSAAREWERAGAQWLHLVDLNGAKEGKPVNDEWIGKIAQAVQIPIQVGGGIRTLKDVEHLFELGVSKIILGTAAIEDRTFVHEVLREFGEKIAIGLDARNGYVATRGWLETSEVKAEELALELAEHGARNFILTDISRDGMMQGPNVEAIVNMAKVSGQNVIASGGVTTIDDLKKLASHKTDGVSGAIVGKALYTGDIQLATALKEITNS